MLILVGLGLGDEKDVTIRGFESIKSADKVYLESYTSILGVSRPTLEKFYQKDIVEADRNFVEKGCIEILEAAKVSNVAFLVVGDPFGATTHGDLFIRAREQGIQVEVIHNASIVNAVGCTGLQLYRFGQIVSVPFFTASWHPSSWIDKIVENRKVNLHTLVLLDIKVKEQTVENMMRGNEVYEPPQFMSIKDAITQIELLNDEHANSQPIDMSTLAFGVARVGSKEQRIVSGTLKELKTIDFGKPLHSLVSKDLACIIS